MEPLQQLLEECMNIELNKIMISNPKNREGVLKIKVRPILLREQLHFQCESFTKTQAFQKNMLVDEVIALIIEWMEEFKQMQIETPEFLYTVLVSKKGKMTIQKKRQKVVVKPTSVEHNRKKNYILEEGVAVPFLEELGVMTGEGKVVRSKFDKFKQINRFLEFIEDVIPQLDKLDKNREIMILDFGCGKSYLTFAMYYYLHILKQYNIRIVGLDLKTDVIAHCNRLSQKFGYDKLSFEQGDIKDYTGVNQVDMVVTLHACNTATDIALSKAVNWGASIILSVPCCQHELNGQIQCEELQPILKYGLIKERIASLVTDGLRAEYLESEGYDTQILEFIDMEHTPKNILIRGIKREKDVKNKQIKEKSLQGIMDCKELLNVDPMLGRLLEESKGL